MKKICILFLIISALSYGIQIETEIKSGVSAAWGGDGIAYPFSHLGNMLRISLPRDNVFDEHYPNIPSFTDEATSGNNTTDNNGTSNVVEDNNIYVKDQNEKDILLSKRYVSRAIQYDRTLIDAKVRLKDYGTEFGLVIKGRPNRNDQAWNLFDVNRSYLTLDINTKPLKLNSVLYLNGYENGTPGLNRFSEDGYRDKKVRRQLDLNAKIVPLKTIISPVVDVEYQGTIKNTFDFKFKPGIKVKVYEDENSEWSVTSRIQVLKNNDKYDVNKLVENIANFTPGNRKIEYFKNWEIGELILDEEYNKDKTILGKEGKAAYRYIGKRDPKLAHLSGLNGSIRSVGTSTGALYGESFFEKVTKEVINVGIANLAKDSKLRDFSVELKSYVDDGGFKSTIFGFGGNTLFLTKYGVQASRIQEEVNKIIENKNGEYDKIISSIIDSIFKMTKIDNRGNLSDFHVIHLMPREFRKWSGDALPPIPYEDSKANIERRKNEKPEPSVIIKYESGESSGNGVVAKVYEEDDNKIKVLGSSKLNKGKIWVSYDSRNSIFSSELKGLIEDSTDLFKEFRKNDKDWIKTILKGWDTFGRLFNADNDITNNDKSVITNLLYSSEALSTYDMFSSLQINNSEKEARIKEYTQGLKEYIATVSNAEKGIKGYNMEVKKQNILTGYDVSIDYRHKKLPLTASFNTSWSGNSKKEKITVDKEIIRKEFVDYLSTNSIPERYIVKFDSSDDTNVDMVSSNYKFNFNTKYNDEKLKLDSRLNLMIDKFNYFKEENKKLSAEYYYSSWSWSTKKENIDNISKFKAEYTNYILNPSLDISYKFEPNKYFDIIPKLSYEGIFEYNKYGKVSGAKYNRSDEGNENSKLEEISIDVFKRDKNNMLIKAKDAPKTNNAEFDNLEVGSSVDISKYSKFLFSDIEKTFEKEKVKGISSWKEALNSIGTSVDVYYKPASFVNFGYHFLTQFMLKGKNIDGFFIRNGISITVKI